MKAGAAWAALEYAKHLLMENQENASSDESLEKKKLETWTDVTIVPASINYSDKSRFRTRAVFE